MNHFCEPYHLELVSKITDQRLSILRGGALNKNKRLTYSLLAGFLSTAISGITFAGSQVVTARQLNNVQEMQAQSIKQGIKVGKLTPKEAQKLRGEQFAIDLLEQKMRENGSLDGEELAVLFKRLEKARNNINKLLRNNISTYGELERIQLRANNIRISDASI